MKSAARHRLKLREIAYIGDDLGDLEVMKAVGLARPVADAHPVVKRAAIASPGTAGAGARSGNSSSSSWRPRENGASIEDKLKSLFDYKR